MTEKTAQVGFRCALASIPVYVTGTYYIDTNSFYVDEVQGQTVEELCNEMHWDEYETTQAIQEAFENR